MFNTPPSGTKAPVVLGSDDVNDVNDDHNKELRAAKAAIASLLVLRQSICWRENTADDIIQRLLLLLLVCVSGMND